MTTKGTRAFVDETNGGTAAKLRRRRKGRREGAATLRRRTGEREASVGHPKGERRTPSIALVRPRKEKGKRKEGGRKRRSKIYRARKGRTRT